MEKQRAIDVLFVGLSSTARRVSEIYGTQDGDQYEGFELVASACKLLGINKDSYYEMQTRVLEKQKELRNTLEAYVQNEFLTNINAEAPTWREISERVGEQE